VQCVSDAAVLRRFFGDRRGVVRRRRGSCGANEWVVVVSAFSFYRQWSVLWLYKGGGCLQTLESEKVGDSPPNPCVTKRWLCANTIAVEVLVSYKHLP